MPLITKVLKPELLNSTELAELHDYAVLHLGGVTVANLPAVSEVDRMQYVLDTLVARGILG
jgi:hypothetical protein